MEPLTHPLSQSHRFGDSTLISLTIYDIATSYLTLSDLTRDRKVTQETLHQSIRLFSDTPGVSRPL